MKTVAVLLAPGFEEGEAIVAIDVFTQSHDVPLFVIQTNGDILRGCAAAVRTDGQAIGIGVVRRAGKGHCNGGGRDRVLFR